jgi:hypothetical protein
MTLPPTFRRSTPQCALPNHSPGCRPDIVPIGYVLHFYPIPPVVPIRDNQPVTTESR